MLDTEQVTEAAPAPVKALQLPLPVAKALATFADVSRRVSLLQAAGWIVALYLFGMTLAALADRFLFLEDSSRQMIATVIYAACALVGWQKLRQALRRMTPAEVALALEARASKEELQERISTTVEIAQGTYKYGDGVSPLFIERVANEAASTIERINVSLLPDRAALRFAAKVALTIVVIAGILCCIPMLHMPYMYARAALPWVNFKRPSDTMIEALTGSTRVAQFDTLNVEAQITGKPTADVYLETRDDHGNRQTMRMETDPHRAGIYTVQLGPLGAPVKYRISAGDGQSAKFFVDVLPRPEVVELKLEIKHPEYSGLSPKLQEGTNGDISALQGSKVEFSLKSNTELAAAVLDFADDRKITLKIEKDRAVGSFEIDKDTSYRVQLRSVHSVTNPDAPLYLVHAVPDLAPQVTVLKPVLDEAVDVSAMVPLEVRAEDDLGIASMRVVMRSDKRNSAVTLPLQKPDDGGKTWFVSQPWDLSGLFLDNSETIVYHVEAKDSKGTIGKSDERRLRVTAGKKYQDRLLLAQLEEAQRLISSSRKLLGNTRQDVTDMRTVFRADNTEFQAAERLLLAETLNRIGRETKQASEALEKGVPNAEAGALQSLVGALSNLLNNFSETGLRPLHRGAARATEQKAETIIAGLDVLKSLVPDFEKDLQDYHEALNAAHRYAGAAHLELRAIDIRAEQERITPVVVGAAGWTRNNSVMPGLLAEYYRGVNYEQLARRTLESRIEMKNQDLPEVGSQNYSVRWQGQVLAPKAGRYVFRAIGDDGVRLVVAGKRLIDEWRHQAATPFESAIELTEGWHNIAFEYFQGQGDSEVNLQRSGPGMDMAAIPPVHLRALSVPVGASSDPRVREAMTKNASDESGRKALVRLQTMVETARSLPVSLGKIAKLEPKADEQGIRESVEWGREADNYTSAMGDLQTLSVGLAVPLLQWKDKSTQWVNNYRAVKERYRIPMLEWARKLNNNVYDFASKLRQLQDNAEAASKAFQELVRESRQPNEPRHEADMAEADAKVRALAEDLKEQTADLAKKLDEASKDSERPIEERRALQALAHKVETMAEGAAAKLDESLEKARTPEELAKTSQNAPNFLTQSEQLRFQAAEMANHAERIERAVAMREALEETGQKLDQAADALTKPQSADAAAEQQRAAAELKETVKALREANEAAISVSQPTRDKTRQVTENGLNNQVAEALEKRAEQALSAQKPDPKQEAEAQKNRAAQSKELEKQADNAAQLASAVNRDLANIADQLEGNLQQQLREAAWKMKEAATAITQAPKDQPKEAEAKIDQAADAAKSAASKAQNTEERVELEAEAAHEAAATAAQHQQADDMQRLAAAIQATVKKDAQPVANQLNRAAQENKPLANSEKTAERANTVANELNKLAELAGAIASPDPARREQGRAELNKMLEEKGIAQQVNSNLEKSSALEALADKIDPAGAQDQPAGQNQPQNSNNNEAADLAAAEKALEKAVADPQAVERHALAEHLSDLAQTLRQQAERDARSADQLDRAQAMEQQARENLKTQAPQIAAALKNAAKNAGELAKTAPNTPLANALNNAQQNLPQSSNQVEQAGKQADTAPLGELAGSLDKMAKALDKPVGEIAGALNPANEKQMQAAQDVGQEIRNSAGKEADLADELQRADRAAQLSKMSAQATANESEFSEQQASAAVDALEKSGLVPQANQEALNAAKQAIKSALADKNEAMNGEANLQKASSEARADAQQLTQAAASMEKLAEALGAQGKEGQAQQGQENSAQAEALAALAKANLAKQSGDAEQAQSLQQQAADALEQAARDARAQAMGKPAKGQASAQSGESESAKPTNANAKGDAEAVALSKPPKGLPIDLNTWNHLPENLRRDLLNAAGSRFPAEYEASIRRYFKNLAANREERK